MAYVEHALLGHRFDQWIHARGSREPISGDRHSRLAQPVRNHAHEGPQSRHRVKHHVRCRTVPALLTSTLEVLEDRGEQAVRVHARDASGCAGYGVRYVSEDLHEMQAQICHFTSWRDGAVRRRTFARTV